MKNISWESVQEVTEREDLPAGGYICGITAVQDISEKEYLKLEYDVAEGPYKNYFRSIFDQYGFWPGNFIRSYKPKALGFFKKFYLNVERSNPGYRWNNDENTLKRKLVGLVIGYEEYLNKNGAVRQRPVVTDVVTVSDIRNGNFKVKELKRLAASAEPPVSVPPVSGGFAPVEDDGDLPF